MEHSDRSEPMVRNPDVQKILSTDFLLVARAAMNLAKRNQFNASIQLKRRNFSVATSVY